MAYVLATDSGCDISPEILESWGIISADLTFRFDGETEEYTNREMPVSAFYDKMKAGGVSRTSAVNQEAFSQLFRSYLEQGIDVLYIGFDSGISSTSQHGIAAANELAEEFPERKMIAIDTLCASGGQGLVVELALNKKNAGADIDEVAAFVREISPSVSHWFTVDDLMYLKRGGRVSAAAAIAGNLLNIRPVLHVDDEGKLINMYKVRGRKASIAALADEYVKRALPAFTGDMAVANGSSDINGSPYFINQGACMEDAKLLEKMIFDKTGRKAEHIMDIGPVIGSHTGPGILALFFTGTSR